MRAFAPRNALFSILFFLLLLLISGAVLAASDGLEGGNPLQTYVVLVEKPEDLVFTTEEERKNWHESFLSRATAEGVAAKSRMVYSYGDVISGFAARLASAELEAIQAMDGFVAAFPDRVLPLLTTHSPGFLGLSLSNGQWSNSRSGEGVVIGMLDTGATPNHPSFSGTGMPPPPAKWKGSCEMNKAYCNNKLIGYKVFNLGAELAGARTSRRRVVDTDGHGTHTASTAAGAPVDGVSVLGYANGTAVGVAPRAHLAIYEVCSDEGCTYTDIMAGISAAVEDGADVLSISLGGSSIPFYEDGLAVATFRAMDKGLVVSCAAGNSGPFPRSLSNEAPWMLTVAASTIDRSLRTAVRLGDGQELEGESIFQPTGATMTDLPLVYPRKSGFSFCEEKALSHFDVKGKVVICDRGGYSGRRTKAKNVHEAGGAGMILANLGLDGYSTVVDVYPIPTANLGFSDGSKAKAYVKSSTNPTVSLVVKGTVIGTSPAPVITSFSSRGPSLLSPGILKPDVTGPGVDIVAAWPFDVDSDAVGGGASPHFNVLSGTSMSTPHLSGVAALVRSAHPDWSPAAVKSAIITTAEVLDREGKPIMNEKLQPASLFAMGAGHVNPAGAEDPGLVYDIQPDDYIAYLCRLRYTDANVTAIVGRRIRCSDRKEAMKADLNYPSISVSLHRGINSIAVRRTVTNVGEASSGYTVKVEQPAGVGVTVSPETLQFSQVGEKVSFTVRFSKDGASARGFAEGHLVWVSEKHMVRSPISVSIA
ncbi:hypothetical protein Taro_035148 [Colocasia esculenta]|uniref:Uncharacterized protein n=1 Tax=Colocasia esculenta TaxID=4460 RepID=A0A843VTI6_COLES|nr:hypothetical protein [Colocasia esculenta]